MIDCTGALYERLVDPLLLAALNTEPPEASARLAAPCCARRCRRRPRLPPADRARRACRPPSSIPALAYLKRARRRRCFGARAAPHRHSTGGAPRRSISATTPSTLAPDDTVILAVPPHVAARLLPGLTAPTEFRAIVNAHFKVAAPKPAGDDRRRQRHDANGCSPSRPPLGHHQRRRRAAASSRARSWRARSGARSRRSPACPAALPPWQIVQERRATFAADPAAGRLRPGAQTAGAISFSPATGPRPACRRPSKAPSAQASAPPTSPALP